MLFCSGISRARKAKFGISWFFLVQGAIFGNWGGILPSVKSEQKVSNVVLGGVLVAAVAGAIIALPVVNMVSRRFGSGFALFLGTLVVLILMVAIGIKYNLAFFTFSVMLLGFGAGWADVAANCQAVLCEKMTRTPTIGLFHSMISIGGLIGALTAGGLIQMGFDVITEILIIAVILIPPSLFLSCWLYSNQEEKLITHNGLLNYETSYNPYDKVSSIESPFDSSISASHHLQHGHGDDDNNSSRQPSSASESNYSKASSSMSINNNNNTQSIDHNNTDRYSYLMHHEQQQQQQQQQQLANGQGNNKKTKSSSRQSQQQQPIQQTDWQVYDHGQPPKEINYQFVLMISSICMFAYFGQGSINDWSAIFLTEEYDATAIISVIGIAGFNLCVAGGTFYSDYLTMRWGRKALLITGGLLSAIGLLLVSLSPFFPHQTNDDHALDSDLLCIIIACLGFSIFGLGSSVVPPSVISMAGSGKTGMASNDAIALVSSVGYIGIMIGPALLGGLSELFHGLQWSFLLVAVMMLMISILASILSGEDINSGSSHGGQGSSNKNATNQEIVVGDASNDFLYTAPILQRIASNHPPSRRTTEYGDDIATIQ